MRKGYSGFVIVIVVFALTVSAHAFVSEDTAAKFSDVLIKAPAANHWQVTADDVYGWMRAKKTDFVVVDVRPNPRDSWAARCPEQCIFLTMRS